jgi:glutathione S-transferase
MIILYHSMSARSFRPLWTLEELGLSYTLKMLPFPPRRHARAYLDVNPLGTVPMFVDSDVRMTESAAICHYLVVRYGPSPLEVTSNEAAFGAFLNWLHFGEATLTFPQTIVLRYSRFEPSERRSSQAAEDYTRWFLARLRGVEAVVSVRPYICADRFTAADISVGYALMLADYLDLGHRFPDAVSRYWRRLQERPAFAQALARQRSTAIEQGVPAIAAPCVLP